MRYALSHPLQSQLLEQHPVILRFSWPQLAPFRQSHHHCEHRLVDAPRLVAPCLKPDQPARLAVQLLRHQAYFQRVFFHEIGAGRLPPALWRPKTRAFAFLLVRFSELYFGVRPILWIQHPPSPPPQRLTNAPRTRYNRDSRTFGRSRSCM